MASKAEKMRRGQVEIFVMETIGNITGINSGDLQLGYCFEGDLCMEYVERTNLSEAVHAEYGVRVDLIRYAEEKTINDFVEEIAAKLL